MASPLTLCPWIPLGVLLLRDSRCMLTHAHYRPFPLFKPPARLGLTQLSNTFHSLWITSHGLIYIQRHQWRAAILCCLVSNLSVSSSKLASAINGVASLWGTGEIASLDFQQFIFFSVNSRAAKSPTATLCGCLSKHLYSATAAAVVPLGYMNFVSCIIWRHFMRDKKFHVVLCPPPLRQILETPLSAVAAVCPCHSPCTVPLTLFIC